MPTPIFDAIVDSNVVRPSERLRSTLEWGRQLRQHAEYFEPLINPDVLEAIRLLERDDASLERAEIEATVSIREDQFEPWRHFGTQTTAKLVRLLLEDFIVMRLHFDRWIEERREGIEHTPSDFSHGAVARRPR